MSYIRWWSRCERLENSRSDLLLGLKTAPELHYHILPFQASPQAGRAKVNDWRTQERVVARFPCASGRGYPMLEVDDRREGAQPATGEAPRSPTDCRRPTLGLSEKDDR